MAETSRLIGRMPEILIATKTENGPKFSCYAKLTLILLLDSLQHGEYLSEYLFLFKGITFFFSYLGKDQKEAYFYIIKELRGNCSNAL